MASLERIKDVPLFRPLAAGEASAIVGGDEGLKTHEYRQEPDGTYVLIGPDVGLDPASLSL